MKPRDEYHWGLPLVLLIVIAAVDSRLYFMAQNTRQEIIVRMTSTVSVSADVVRGRVDDVLDTYDRTLSGIGEVISVRGEISDKSDVSAHRLLIRRHAITPGLRWLLLIRKDGTLGEESSGFPAPNLDLSDREYFQTQADSWDRGFFLGPPLLSKLENKSFIPISRRVVNDGSRFLGVVAGGIDPDQLTHLLAAESLPIGYSLYLFIDDGKALVCHPINTECLARNWHRNAFFEKQFQDAPRGEFDSADFLPGSQGPGAYSHSDRYPVVAVVTADEELILAPWQRSLDGYWMVALSSNIFLIGIALFAFRQIKRRRYAMDKLAEANQLLEQRVTSRTAELHRSELRARTFMNTAMDAVLVIDGESRVLEFNKTAEKMFGFSAEEILGQHLEILMPVVDASHHLDFVHAANSSQKVRMMGRGREVLAQAKDGHQFPIEVTVGSSSENGESLHVGIIRDITERKLVEQELRRLATTDGLTGILNRRAFTENAVKLIALAQRYQHTLALMIVDADHFKKVNDTYGHPAGDAVLKALSESINEVLRSTDLFGRLGGEEFGIVVPETDGAGVECLADRLLSAVRQSQVTHDSVAITFTVSIGVAYLLPNEDFETIFQRADGALYQAKQSGRDCFMLDKADFSEESGIGTR